MVRMQWYSFDFLYQYYHCIGRVASQTRPHSAGAGICMIPSTNATLRVMNRSPSTSLSLTFKSAFDSCKRGHPHQGGIGMDEGRDACVKNKKYECICQHSCFFASSSSIKRTNNEPIGRARLSAYCAASNLFDMYRARPPAVILGFLSFLQQRK